MNSRYHLLAFFMLFLVLMTQGCNPWRFALQPHADYPIEGRILRNKNSVDVFAANAIRISSPASVAIRSEQITDGEFSTEVRLLRGSGFDMVMRSTPFDDSTNGGTHKLNIHIYRDTSSRVMAGEAMASVSSADTTVTLPITLPTKGGFRIVVTQQGVYTDIQVACTSLGRFKTTTPSTQWISINPVAGATLEVVDPLFRSLEDLYFTSAQDVVDRFNNSVR